MLKFNTRPKMVTALMETFGLSLVLASVIAALLLLVGLVAVFWIFQALPPRTLVMSTGPAGSSFQRIGEMYQQKLAERGVTLKLVPSQGSFENLQRLKAPQGGGDVGFVQSGQAGDNPPSEVMSLGSVSFQPLLIFYRGPAKLDRLSELAGKRLAVGAEGSGSRALATALLQANEIAPGGTTTFVNLDADAAATALVDNKVDAVFLMGDSAPVATMRKLLRADGVRLFSFKQADAYVRRFAYLNKVELPEGAIDLGKDLPADNVELVAPTVQLVARKGLHPALSDLLLETATEVHGRATMIQKRGEFPAPLAQDFKISPDATRFYKSGVGYIERMGGPFWLSSLLERVVVVIVPALLVLIPTVRFFPTIYRITNRLKIFRCYRPLLQLERESLGNPTPEQRAAMLKRLDEIEEMVNRLRMPASFADQFYELRGHIAFVRRRIVPEQS